MSGRFPACAALVGFSLVVIAAGVSAILMLGLIAGASAYAQVATDGSVGPRVRLPRGDFEIGADLGRQAGRNLFHSFERFSLATGERATFTAPDEARIGRIISRVTGGDPSDIDGTIRSTIAGADFYFLNPAGVVFGRNASLDVKGSFHVSTADELRFADGAVFSADRDAASSFTVARPEAFGFLRAERGAITVDRSTLDVPAGRSFSIVGGDIIVDGGNNGAASGGEQGLVRAEAGQITLAALGGPGEARLRSGEVTADEAADITLVNQAFVDASGDGGGTIRVRGGEIVADGEVRVFADNNGVRNGRGGLDIDAEILRVRQASLLTADALSEGTGGDVVVRAGMLAVTGNSRLAADTFADGNAGSVQIEADELRFRSGGRIRSQTSARGNAGSVAISAGRVLIRGSEDGVTGILSDAEQSSSGSAGTVTVSAGEVEIREGGVISSDTFAQGNAGAVTVTADRLLIRRGATEAVTGILSDSSVTEDGERAQGGAGRVTVTARELRILGGGEIRSNTFADGNAGAVNVDARRLLVVRGADSLIRSDASTAADAEPSTGNGGVVSVRAAGEVRMLGGGQIRSNTIAQGNAGAVTVTADQMLIRGDGAVVTGILSDTRQGSSGSAGTVAVSAGGIEILDGGQIRSETFAAGNAGAVTVIADRLLIQRGDTEVVTGILSNAEPESGGSAGRVTVTAGELRVLGGGVISSDTFAQGNAGSVDVAARRLVMRAGQTRSFISSDAEVGSQGNAGNVTVDADALIMRGSSVVRSSTFGPGNAGNVTVTADRLLMEATSSITSEVGPASTGNAGMVIVNGRKLEILDESRIASDTAGRGDAGTILVAADRLVLNGRSDEAVPLISSASTARDGVPAQGNAGDVIIQANRIDVLRGGQISATTFADGRGGDVDLEAGLLVISDDGSLEATGIFSGSEGGPDADSGTVRVQADRLFIFDGGEIRGSTFGSGDAGSVEVLATQLTVAGRGAEITSEAFEGSSGIAGDVTLRAKSILLRGGGSISSSSQGRGAAGTVTISADALLALNGGEVTTASRRAGGGEIIINVQRVIDAQDSRMSATVAGGDDPTAGNILIDPEFLIIDGSQIQANANAPRGFGGNVRIVADNIVVSGGDFEALVERGDISASGGDPSRTGTVVVNAPEVDLAGGLVVLKSGFVDTARLRERCGARRDVGASSFTGVGRGGLPPGPDGPLGSSYVAAGVSEADRAAGGTMANAALGALSERRQEGSSAEPTTLLPCRGVL